MSKSESLTSTISVNINNVSIVDSLDNLDLYHFSGNIPENNEDSEYRGIIKHGDKTIVKTFPFTPEISIDNNIDIISSNTLFNEIINSSFKTFTSYEGSLLRLFYYNDKWYLCTHKKLDASTSKWGSKLTYRDLFNTCLNSININTLEEYTEKLNKSLTYVFLIRTFNENRIVCRNYIEPKAYTIGAFNNITFEFIFNLDNALNESLFECPEILELNNLNDISNHVNNIDIYKTQGVILINQNGKSLKLLNKKYNELFLLRKNQPSVLFRYIQLYKEVADKSTEYSVLESYRELYNEHIDLFNDYHETIKHIANNIYKIYIDRYILKKISIAPPEQHSIIKKLHSEFIQSNYKNRITKERITNYLSCCITNILFNLYTLYKDRQSRLQDGNSVAENKDYVNDIIFGNE